MATRPPPQTKAILATPLNVEESKAQRQQRSQARFRDRGGIFVPSNRNTLADILLGKAPLLTKPRRSVSASPSLRRQSKGRRSSPRKSNAALRRSESPVKQGRKTGNSASREVLANVEPATEQNVAIASTKTQNGKQPAKPKARHSSTKGLKAAEADPPDDEHESHSNINPGPSTKPGANTKTSKKPVSNAMESLPAARKPKPKAKSASKGVEQHTLEEMEDSTKLKQAAGKRAPHPSTKIKAVVNEATVSASTVSNATKNNVLKASNTPAVVSSSSSAKAGPSNSARPKRRKSGDLYSCGESEDEYVPKVPKKKGPPRTSSSSKTAPVKKHAAPTKGALPAIMEEDEDQDAEVTHSSSNVPPSRFTLANKPDAMKSSSRAKASSTEKTKSSRSKAPAASDSEHNVKAKGSKSGKGSSGKRKEVASQDDDESPAIAAQKPHGTKGSRPSSAKSKKRRADDIDPAEEETEPPAKRPKGSGKATSGSKTVTSKKRSRDHEEEDLSDAETKANLAKKSAKRKRTANGPDTDLPPPPEVKKGKTPGDAALKAKKPSSQASKNVKNPAKKSAKKPNQIDNSSSEKASQPQAPVVKRGPPKSVLARIKASAQIHEVDNDPDEIDFLS